MQDKMEKEKADAKNAVEEYVYEIRNSLNEDGVLAKFVSEEVCDLQLKVHYCFKCLFCKVKYSNIL